MLFYFTGTGNSQWIAERIAEKFSEKVFDIAEEIDGDCTYELEENEHLGFVLPVHYYGLPVIVYPFLQKLKINGDHNVFLVYNYGSYPGRAFSDAEKTFTECGFTITKEYGLVMPENYVMFFNPPSEEDAKRIISDANVSIDDITVSLKDDGESMVPKKNLFGDLFGIIARPFYLHGRRTGKFYVKGTCTRCGKCSRMCPSKAIEMVDGIPTWTSDRCYICNACINRCPQRAIEYGHRSSKKRRYANPYVDFKKR